MTTSSMDKKTIKDFIITNRDNGKTDQEIYNDLIKKYPSQTHSEKMRIELLISKTVNIKLKNKYKPLNILLLVLIGVKIIMLLLAIINILLKNNYNNTLFYFSIYVVIYVYLIVGIANYRGAIYGQTMTIAIAFFTLAILQKSYEPIGLIMHFIVIILSYYLDKKLCPRFKSSS